MFSVSGNRPQQNLFLLNGVEFTGAAENNMTPGGASGQLLGIDAVREFNMLRDTYGAEYGKKPGGQISIVTQSGTNQWHGSTFEFLRNNALDAPNFFDAGLGAAVSAESVRRLRRRPDPEGQDVRVRQLRGIPREPAPDVGGVRARRAVAAGRRAHRQDDGPAEPVAGGAGGRSRLQGDRQRRRRRAGAQQSAADDPRRLRHACGSITCFRARTFAQRRLHHRRQPLRSPPRRSIRSAPTC